MSPTLYPIIPTLLITYLHSPHYITPHLHSPYITPYLHSPYITSHHTLPISYHTYTPPHYITPHLHSPYITPYLLSLYHITPHSSYIISHLHSPIYHTTPTLSLYHTPHTGEAEGKEALCHHKRSSCSGEGFCRC